MAKKQKVLVATPRGVAVFPTLHTPDTKFDADGVYKIDLKLSGADAQEFQAKVDGWHRESIAAAKKENAEKAKEKGKKATPVKENNPPYSENEDGSIDFKFKMPAKITIKNGSRAGEVVTLRPQLVDAAMKPISKDVKIGGGSVVRVSFEVRNYNSPQGAGVKLSLVGVQVIELKTWGGGPSGAAMGFEAVEGGFSAADVEETLPDTDESSDEAPAADDAEPEGSGDF